MSRGIILGRFTLTAKYRELISEVHYAASATAPNSKLQAGRGKTIIVFEPIFPPFQSGLHTPRPLLRATITDACRHGEAQSVDELVMQIDLPRASRRQVEERARKLVAAVRGKRAHAGGVDALMHEFSLSSQEGIALMCLAEALLRIPDRETADRLIRDKISRADWGAHLGQSPSLF